MKKSMGLLIVASVMILLVLYTENQYELWSGFFVKEMTEEDKAEYLNELYEHMLNKEEVIEMHFYGSEQDMEEFAINSATEVFRLDKEDTSSDYDYMRYVHYATNVEMVGRWSQYKIVYTMSYLESKEQTEQVDKEIKRIIKKYKIKNMSDYNKIKTIHDYIVDHCHYDLSVDLNSPYAALLKGASACQGYAALFYKMMTEAGVPCRVITGTANGSLHAWNIVKLGDVWYNVDTTWDDPVGLIGDSHARYDYFLKTDEGMKKHTRDAEFATDTFYAQYPMARKSYR